MKVRIEKKGEEYWVTPQPEGDGVSEHYGGDTADQALGLCVIRKGVPRRCAEAFGRIVREHAAELGIEIEEG